MLTATDLANFRNHFFQMQLGRTLALIEACLQGYDNPYIAYSSGKDSEAMKALVHRINPAIPLSWSDDELEYPETVALMESVKAAMGEQMIITTGWATHAGWFRPWSDDPYWRDPLPGTLYIYEPVEKFCMRAGCDLAFVGVRAGESAKRRAHLTDVAAGVKRVGGITLRDSHRMPGLYRNADGRWVCNPLWDWSTEDVWALIAGWGLPYNHAYDIMDGIGIQRISQRVGPLPLVPRSYLERGWPDLLERLEERYGPRWS